LLLFCSAVRASTASRLGPDRERGVFSCRQSAKCGFYLQTIFEVRDWLLLAHQSLRTDRFVLYHPDLDDLHVTPPIRSASVRKASSLLAATATKLLAIGA
jgi:hypothetical protein